MKRMTTGARLSRSDSHGVATFDFWRFEVNKVRSLPYYLSFSECLLALEYPDLFFYHFSYQEAFKHRNPLLYSPCPLEHPLAPEHHTQTFAKHLIILGIALNTIRNLVLEARRGVAYFPTIVLMVRHSFSKSSKM